MSRPANDFAKRGMRPKRAPEVEFAELTAKETIRQYAKAKGKSWKEPKKQKGLLGRYAWTTYDQHTPYIKKVGKGIKVKKGKNNLFSMAMPSSRYSCTG